MGGAPSVRRRSVRQRSFTSLVCSPGFPNMSGRCRFCPIVRSNGAQCSRLPHFRSLAQLVCRCGRSRRWHVQGMRGNLRGPSARCYAWTLQGRLRAARVPIGMAALAKFRQEKSRKVGLLVRCVGALWYRLGPSRPVFRLLFVRTPFFATGPFEPKGGRTQLRSLDGAMRLPHQDASFSSGAHVACQVAFANLLPVLSRASRKESGVGRSGQHTTCSLPCCFAVMCL